MTPDELRSLADEAAREPLSRHWPYYLSTEQEALMALAPDLARLCAELGEALANIEVMLRRRQISRDTNLANTAGTALAKLDEALGDVT